jgi:hypothetical protein
MTRPRLAYPPLMRWYPSGDFLGRDARTVWTMLGVKTSPRPGLVWVGPVSGDEVAMPAQQRGWCARKTDHRRRGSSRARVARRPVRRCVAGSGDLATPHAELVTDHRDLYVLVVLLRAEGEETKESAKQEHYRRAARPGSAGRR